MQPSSANPTMKLSTALMLNTFRLKRRSGRIGSAARYSATTKQPRKTTPPTTRPMIVGEPQPYWVPPQLVARISPADPSEMNAIPRVSKTGRPGGSGREQPDRQRDDHQRDRHVDVEDPLPRQVVGEEATEQRPEDRRSTENRADRALVLAPVTQRDDVGDHRGRGDGQTAAADALQCARPDQPGHRLRQPRQRGGDGEHDDAADEDRLASEQVAELAAQNRGDRLSEQVGRHHPTHVLRAAEIPDDGRERSGDDRGVECRQQDPAHDQAEGDVASSRPERLRVVGCCRSSTASTCVMGASL